MLTTDKQARKQMPIARGVLDYFPLAIAAVAHLSYVANQQHNPGEPMHWAKEKSTDHADCIVRHLIERGKIDDDGMRHSAKVAWRALALLQIELEKAAETPEYRFEMFKRTDSAGCWIVDHRTKAVTYRSGSGPDQPSTDYIYETVSEAIRSGELVPMKEVR